VSRLSRAPLFAQTLALVAATALAAQLITLIAVVAAPIPHQSYTLAEAAAAIRGEPPAEPTAVPLAVEIVEVPPAGWEKDDRMERRIRLTLARILERPPADVLVEQQLPVPGAIWVLRLNQPHLPEGELPTQPHLSAGAASFEDAAIAVRRADGRWTVVSDPSPILGVSLYFLLWLAVSALLLAALAWLFTRRLVEPIRAFAAAAEAAGRGDPEASFPVAGPREVRTAASALAEMQRRIAGAVEERTNLIAAIAHDLRTPLTRLRFKAENLAPEHRAAIVDDLERMDSMIGGVLAFARGEGRVVRERLDLSALVQSAIDDLSDTGADVAMDAADPVEVRGDSLALRRLVANLLDNALRYGGSARCRVCREGDDALVLIEDEGPGVAGDALERMFTPFERGDAARDPSTGGVGLGLALARGIARAHGGDVWLSRRPAGGLRAHVRLPVASLEVGAAGTGGPKAGMLPLVRARDYDSQAGLPAPLGQEQQTQGQRD
jgi:signal transduction histidine kinase